MHFSEADWRAYIQVNRIFADAILQLNPTSDDIIWIHDYHLMLVPQLISSKCISSIRIGFFLHTPFPSYELFRMLPVAATILEGVLGSDIIGFHSHDYAQHFTKACVHIMGRESFESFKCKCLIRAFPIGINVENFVQVQHIPYSHQMFICH